MSYTSPMQPALILAAVLLAAAGPLHAQTTWYVDDDAPGDPGPGSSWISDPLEDGSAAHPFDGINEGVNAAVDGDTVLVRDGNYSGSGNNSVGLGGRLITVRSENGPDTCAIVGRFFLDAGETPDTVIEGFTIQDHWVGIRLQDSSPTIRNCVLWNHEGSAMLNWHSSPVVLNCEFRGNRSASGSIEAYGGAVSNRQLSNPVFQNCLFAHNYASPDPPFPDIDALIGFGGAVYSDSWCYPTFDHCVFLENFASAWCGQPGCTCSSSGGAIFSEPGCVPLINHCVFLRNHDNKGNGGAIYGDADIRQSLFVGNTAHSEGSITGGTIVNSIFWQNSPSAVPGSTSYCLININPLFVNPAIDDYRLAAGSPAIDAGNNFALDPCAVDLDGNERFFDRPSTPDTGLGTPPVVDIGPYEFGGQPADCNANWVIDECEPDGWTDCNSNGFWDLCDLNAGTSTDCNGNQLPDACDLASGMSQDCNTNETPDICDISGGTSTDCNGNQIPDDCDLVAGTSEDCNDNLVPDACESDADCNANGVQDICDAATQPNLDCNGNFVLDACEGLFACDPPIPAHCSDGDVHCDGVVNGLDVAYIISSGTWGMPTCMAAYPRADCNHDGMVNGLDVAMCVNSSCWGL